MYPNEDTTQYQVAIPTDDWTDWKQTVPRDTPLYARIHTLLRIDTAAGGVNARDSDGWDSENEQMVRLLSNRIHHRAKRALQALDNDNRERVHDELSKIVDFSGQIEQ